MPLDIHSLPDDPAVLKQMLEQQTHTLSEQTQVLSEKEACITAVEAQVQQLLEQFRLAQHRQFGKSSEAHPGQRGLFDEAEAEMGGEADTGGETEVETISYTHNKPKRKPLPAELPREQVILDIPDEEKVCDCCVGPLHHIGQDSAERLEFIPAQLKVIETIRPKYACRHCEQQGETINIKQAPPDSKCGAQGHSHPKPAQPNCHQ